MTSFASNAPSFRPADLRPYVEPPGEWARETTNRQGLFLAGGITGCEDWQARARRLVEERGRTALTVLNPRRADFDVSDPRATHYQIAWEHSHLRKADAVLFWFPSATLCPITLFELGVQAAGGKPLAVGCQVGYAREDDVREQLLHYRPEVRVRYTLEDVVSDAMLALDEALAIRAARKALL